MSIIKLLNKKLDRTLFTTPSHSQKVQFSKDFEDFYAADYSEVVGFDNLAYPTNSILLSEGKVSDILKTKQTLYSTQGSTTCILASMKALIKPADRVLVARNCHKSVYNGLILTAGFVDWFLPDYDENWGIYTKIDPEKLDANLSLNDYKVFIMTSPTYEGINSDIEKISQICKKHNVYLIVDEAHGSLFNFSSNLAKTAIEQGADVSINSLHKTAGALNQCAILNINSDIKNIDVDIFRASMNIIHTTSPSYPLLANIENCVAFLNSQNGRKKIDELICEIEKMKNELKRFGVEFYEDGTNDPTKILVRKQGISGFDLSDTMFDEFKIEDELNNQNSCLYLTGLGTTKQKLDKLKNALKKIQTNPSFEFSKIEAQPCPITKLQPVDAFNREFMYVNKNECLLKISNKTILPYPPGIGILYPGEAIQKWHLDYLNDDVEVIV